MKKIIILVIAALHQVFINAASYEEIALPSWKEQLAHSLSMNHSIVTSETTETKIVLLSTENNKWYIIDKTGKNPVAKEPREPIAGGNMPLLEDLWGIYS